MLGVPLRDSYGTTETGNIAADGQLLPGLDYRLVEFAFSLESRHKIRDFTNKRVEREYARGRVPDAKRGAPHAAQARLCRWFDGRR